MNRVVNPLPQLIAGRVAALNSRIEAMLWERSSPVTVTAGPVTTQRVELSAAKRRKFATLAPNTHFGPVKGGWQHRWLRVDVPAAVAGERGRRFLRLDCQGEATAYRDGQPWAGFDPAHRAHLLPDAATTLWFDLGTWETGIWIGGAGIGRYGLRFDGCEIKVRDPVAWACRWDLDALRQLIDGLYERDGVAKPPAGAGYMPPLERCSPLLRRILRRLDDACDAFDRAGGERPALPILRRELARIIAGIPAESWQPIAALVGHAHIDLVWLWPERVTERKGIHTFATQLRLMERYPEFIFTQSQPALYRAIERLEPGLSRAISKRIASGQWEAMGGFEVEPDNQLPSGEALARSLVLGQAKLAELTGKPSTLCWIPDVFGYAACLPQLLRLAGVDRFYTTKMTWSAITKFPYNSFVWRGNDGSEVLTHLCTTGYNGDLAIKGNISEPMFAHRQADVHPELLLSVGFGDGGGGTTEDMLERARRLGSLAKGGGLAGVPKAKWTTTASFFDRLERVRDRLPVYQGELYLEYHRGTFTTQSDFKLFYRRAETSLQVFEAVRVVRGGKPIAEKPWQRVSFAQFHDAIPGSSIRDVYAEFNPELKAIGDQALKSATDELSGAGRHYVVFNPLPIARTVAVELPKASGYASDGIALPQQIVGSGKAARSLALVTLPGLGSVQVQVAPRERTAAIEASPRLLHNGILRAEFDARGRLSRLLVDGEDLGLSAPAGLRMYRDVPANYDAWDIDHQAFKLGCEVADDLRLQVVEQGPARAVLRAKSAIGERSSLVIDYMLESGSRWLRVEMSIEWRERHQLLKFHVPTAWRGTHARFGLPFGSIARSQLPGIEKDEAAWEVPGSRWAAVGDDAGHGLAICAEAKF
ncbi:MAG: glycoside hydrolase family 38 C-terminal domain-containing protein, partial [Planctomycetota bacterium]